MPGGSIVVAYIYGGMVPYLDIEKAIEEKIQIFIIKKIEPFCGGCIGTHLAQTGLVVIWKSSKTSQVCTQGIVATVSTCGIWVPRISPIAIRCSHLELPCEGPGLATFKIVKISGMKYGSVSCGRLGASWIAAIAGDYLVGLYHGIQCIHVCGIQCHIIGKPDIVVSRSQVMIQCSKTGHSTTEAGRASEWIIGAESLGAGTV